MDAGKGRESVYDEAELSYPVARVVDRVIVRGPHDSWYTGMISSCDHPNELVSFSQRYFYRRETFESELPCARSNATDILLSRATVKYEMY